MKSSPDEPLLALVLALGELEGALQLLQVGLGVVGPDLLQEGVDPRRRARLAAAKARPWKPPAAALRRLLELHLFAAVHADLLVQVSVRGASRGSRQPRRGHASAQ